MSSDSSSMTRTDNVPDYSSRDYWDRRFTSDSDGVFEWLQPLSKITPFIRSEVEKRADIKLLHIGCGSSLLSNELRRLETEDRKNIIILNLDFSQTAIELGQQHELQEFGNVKMHWGIVDLLDWNGIRNVCSDNDIAFFDIIVEKSCSDAIACGVCIELSDSEDPASDIILPEMALAVHLGRITRPGAVWIALSYSADRFDYLKPSSEHSEARLMWTIEDVQPLSTTDLTIQEQEHSEEGAMVYRPEVFHYVYVLRRNDH